VAAVRHQLIGFLERPFVEQKLDALAGRHLALFVLALAPLRPPPSSANWSRFFSSAIFSSSFIATDYSRARHRLV